MSGELLFALIVLLTIGAIVSAVILFNQAKKLGKDTNAGLGCTRAAWIIIAVYASLAIAGLVCLCVMSSLWVVILIIGLPIIILVGLILTISYGISYLVQGYDKNHPDKRKVSIGMTCLIINASIILAIGILIILFMSGAIPIRLM